MLSVIALEAACARNDSAEFVVMTPAGRTVRHMQVEVCGRSANASGSMGTFTVMLPVTCEGEAHLTATFEGGSGFNCKAGYITPGVGRAIYHVKMLGDHCEVRIEAMKR